MPEPMPLILSEDAVPKMSMRPVRSRVPSVAVVYASGDGEVHVLDDGRPLPWSGQLFSRYRKRYEVNISEIHREVKLASQPLPAFGDADHFDAEFSLRVRVTDPAEVVRRNIRDGFGLIADYLKNRIRDITRSFPVEQAAEAEMAVNEHFREPIALPQGISIIYCRARLRPDAAALRHITARRDFERQRADRDEAAQIRLGTVDLDNTVAEREQKARLEREQREDAAIGPGPLTHDRLNRLAIAKGGDVGTALGNFDQRAEAQQAAWDREQDRYIERLALLKDGNLLSPHDVGSALQGGVAPQAPVVQQGPAYQAITGTVGSWDAPLPAAALPASAARGDQATPSTGIILEPLEVTTALPVYLVVDLSAAGAVYLDIVNTGLRSVLASLAATPGVNGIVRVSVIGYSDQSQVQLPMQPIDVQASMPSLVSGGGETRYAGAFEQLHEVIPPDMAALKSRIEKVFRPMVFFLAGAQPADEVPLEEAHSRLMDRRVQPYPPKIIVGGVGGVSPQLVAGIATQPEFAFVSLEDPRLAVRRYLTYVAQQIVASGQAALVGQAMGQYQRPEGFRIVNEPI